MAAARSRLAVALAALGVAFAACLGGDHGAARAAVGDPTGPLIGSPLAGAAILRTADLAPGRSRSGEITVTNIGDQSGDFSLGTLGLGDVGAPLSSQLDLAVEDVTPGRTPATVYAGKLAGLSAVGLGSMAQGETHRYRFTVTLPSDVDDSFQGATSAVTFLWTATGADVPTAPPSGGTGGGGGGGATGAGGGTGAPATTAEAPPVAKGAGRVVRPRAAIAVVARQRPKNGALAATVTCQAACRITVSGTVTVAGQRLKLPAVKSTLRKAGSARVRVKLPAKARLALAARRPVAVRLTMKATIGTRVVTVRRTVRVTPPSR
jgi:spore coat-associated protein N